MNPRVKNFKIEAIKAGIIWLALTAILFALLYIFNPFGYSLTLTLIIILPLIPTVHINTFLIDKFFSKGKYLQYFSLVVIVVSSVGLLNQLIANQFLKSDDFFAVFLNPLIAVIIASGIKGFIDNSRIRIQMAEAKTKQTKAELRLSEIEGKQTKAELSLLKSQINPHFLFNTLNGIYSMSLANSANTSKSILLLSKLMRYQLESSKLPTVPLQDEISFIKDYIELEKFRVGDKCRISYSFTEKFSTSVTVPPLLFIPLVENCFKHGIGVSKNKNFIDIKLEIQESELSFLTQNNIPKNENSEREQKSSTGIENLKRRLELLYKGNFELKIISDNNFETCLKIKL